MATNEILRFAETDTGTNLLTQAEYLADSQRPIGNQPGVARSKLVNKALRQASLIAAGLAEYIADNQANNITDALTPQNIADYLQAAIAGALGVTPPQFDNDTSLATTAFVQRAIGNFAAHASAASNTTFVAGDVGKCIFVSGTAPVMTLPLSSNVSAGSQIEFVCQGTSASVTKQGADIIQNPATTVTSIALGTGDTVIMETNGAGAWYVVGGSVALKAAAAFGFSLASNGYQKLPSGLIIQWGSFTTSTAGFTTYTFPIAFPNVCLHVAQSTQGSASLIGTPLCNLGSRTATTVPLAMSNNANGFLAVTQTVVSVGY